MATKKLAPSTKAELQNTLWKAADKLRGSMEASQYRDVVLGLVFLKYISDAFEERREQLRGELADDPEYLAEALEDVDEYTAEGVFWVPERSRWQFIAEHAKGRRDEVQGITESVGDLIDGAMEHLGVVNETLRGVLPRVYGGENVDQRRLGELVDLFSSTRFSGEGASKARDLLGETYEYFLDKFARAEGKRGGEFYTPRAVVQTLVEILEPHEGRVYDPCCGSGGMFVQAEKFLERREEDPTKISVWGQEAIERTWRMAKMNLAIHRIDAKGLGARWQDTFARDLHADKQMDYVLANPPFNIKEWTRREDDSRWSYGTPPARNANFGWMQHILSKLNSRGEAAVVMANGTMTSTSGGEGEIRAAMLKDDVVSCVLALPSQMFRTTQIPACVWFFAKDKSSGPKGATDRTGQVLFIDAREMGHMVDRVERTFSEEDVQRIANAYRTWRGRESAVGEYEDVPGFCYSASLTEIEKAGFALTPGRYVGSPEAAADDEPMEEKIKRLTKELTAALDESARLDTEVRKQLGRIA
ncbi:type I restriction-modification system subunit M [Rothia kristinae]|uniref:type I restriction-modification system subunit M n=1 Tax=Rothia kristinae TaxID=37923 RepID=UPI0022E31333|nr:class I SAM-dependent DNA methyltransferase [Rothia kristinae]